MNYSQATDIILKGTTFSQLGLSRDTVKSCILPDFAGLDLYCTGVVRVSRDPFCSEYVLKLTKSFVSGVIKHTVAFLSPRLWLS